MIPPEKPKKFLIFDTGSIITLSMNGLLYLLGKLKKEFNGEFIITPHTKKELIDRPMKIKKYEFEAIKIKNLIRDGILKMSNNFIKDKLLNRETDRILKIINSSMKSSSKPIELIHHGEASCIAFSNLCNCESVIVIDERTTRMLVESPLSLKTMMEKKLHTSLSLNEKDLKTLKNARFIRSTELLYIAYKKSLFNQRKDKTLLEAALYAAKYKGAAISLQEIEEIKSLV